MFVDVDSIVIDNVSMGQYLLSAKYDYNKLWGSDTGRNLARKNDTEHWLEYFQS